MNGDLASAAIILQVMGETECLLTEDCGKLLLFFDFRLVEDLPSSLSEFAVSRLRAEMSCVGLSRISIVPAATTDFVVLLASPLTGMEMFGARPMVL